MVVRPRLEPQTFSETSQALNPYPAAKVYTSAISTAAKVSVNKCSTEDAHIPPLSPYSIFILMFTIINIMWKLKSKE